MTDDLQSLAPAARGTLTEWHRFVETRNGEVLAPLFAQDTVFRSPFVHLPIPGRPASLLILSAVVQIFENFRYHRTFVAGVHDVALEFSANIGPLDQGYRSGQIRPRRKDRRFRGDDPSFQGLAGAERPDERADRT